MIGDGSYLMMNSEIVSAVAEGLDLTVVLVDNRAYGSIRGLQMACGSKSFNNELRHRDPRTGRTDGPGSSSTSLSTPRAWARGRSSRRRWAS
jgi:3D-(3,5/4)-trihydroxycyclohexane-1,2-dione acylhydrolase (decyclizing)